MKRRVFSCSLAVFLAASATLVSSTATGADRIDACANCFSAAAFAHAAEQISMQEAPFATGLEEVYVFNPVSNEVRFFHVNRWLDDQFDPQGNARSKRRSPETPYRTQGFFRAEAFPMLADPSEVASIQDGIDAARDFSLLVAAGAYLEDLADLGDMGIDSAVSLVGPDDSPAGLRRIALMNAINNHLGSELSLLQIGLADLARQAMRKILGDSDITFMANFRVYFDDGTVIDVKIVEILDAIDGDTTAFELEVDQSSAQGPNLPAVPQSPGQFGSFSFSGNETTLEELAQLAQLYGIPVVRSGGGSGGCTMTCEVFGDELRCTVQCSAH